MTNTRNHIPVLDGIRGLAILLVLIAHFNGEAVLKVYFPIIGPIITKLALTGLYGVDLFFILSGFLITGILLKTKGSEQYFLNFYARRVLRIFPLYYGVLFVLFWFLPNFIVFDETTQNLTSHQWWLWLYLNNVPGHPSWDSSTIFHLGHFWSLAVEEHFYLFWPFVVYSCSVKQLKKICLSWTALSLLAGLLSFPLEGALAQMLGWSTIRLSGGLTLGAYGALIAHKNGGLEIFASSAKKWAFYAGIVFLTVAFVPRRFGSELITILLHYISWGFFSALVIIVLTSGPRSYFTRFFSSNIMMFFGKLSYGLYVYHGLLRPTFERWFDRENLINLVGSPLIGILLYFVICIAVSVVLSWLSWHLFENQFLKFKKLFQPSFDKKLIKKIYQPAGE